MLDPYLIVVGLVFFVMLTVLVAAHEYGHYLFARMFGMEVEAFALMLGGIRKTDLRPYLVKPLVSGWVLVGVAASFIIVWDVLVRTGASPIALYFVQFGAVVGVPLWIISRITALYHASFGNALKWLVVGSLAWVFLLRMFGTLQAVQPTAYIPLLAPITLLAVIVTYYLPVAKREEEEEYGHGQVLAGEGQVPVRFRPVWSIRRGATEYSLLAMPLGGFAKIKGMQPREDGSEVAVPGGFFSKPAWQRLLVLFAGPLFSVLAGMVLFLGIFAMVGATDVDNAPVLGKVRDKTPASEAGLKEGDRIMSADGIPIAKFNDLRAYVSARAGVAILLTLRRGERTLSVNVTPAQDTEPTPVFDGGGNPTDQTRIQGKLGIQPRLIRRPLSLTDAAREAFLLPFRAVAQLAQRFTTPSKLQQEVGGIATVAAATDAASRQGIPEVLELAAGLSMSLGIFNLLPIYPLDGGQMMVALMEMLRRRRLSLKVQNMISSLGFALILMIVLFVLVNDTRKLSAGDSPQLQRVDRKK